MMSYDYPHPVSRTYQYKKITKPLLERKRRARINRCLDELKDLMVDALETEGENISKLEKADILELTVRHLQRLQASRPSGLSTAAIPGEDSSESRWRSGFGHCAAEACRFLTSLPGEAADRLARHLASGLQATKQLEVQVKQKAGNSPPLSPIVSRSSSLVSPILSSLEKTAKLLLPSAVSPGSSSSGSISSNSSRISNVSIGSPVPRSSLSPRTTLHPYCGGKAVSSNNNSIIDRPLSTSCQVVKEEILSGCYLGSNNNDVPNRVSQIVERSVVEMSKDENRLSTVDKEKSDDFHSQFNNNSIADDDEEIDVENIDDGDPMWRPW